MLTEEFSFVVTLRMTSLKHAYLPQITLRASHLSLALTLDLNLHLSPALPFVEHVDISLAEVPLLDLSVMPLNLGVGDAFIDLAAFPGVGGLLHSELEAHFFHTSNPEKSYLTPRHFFTPRCPYAARGVLRHHRRANWQEIYSTGQRIEREVG